MARPLYAQINLAALRANLARAREQAPGTQVLAVVKANAYGHGLHARAAGARGRRRPRAGRARRRDRRCASGTTRAGSCCSKASSTRDELPEIAQRRLADCGAQRGAGADARDARVLPRPLEVFVKVNTGMNRLGIRVRPTSRDVCERLSTLAVGRGAAADDAFRARRRGRRHRRSRSRCSRRRAAACRIRARSPIPPASSAYAEVGGDIVRPGIMLYGATPFPYDTAEMLGLRPVMTLRSEIIAVQDRSKANESVGYGGDVHRVARAPHRRRRLRLCRRLSAPRAQRHAGARVRQEGAPRRPACRWT